MIEIINKYGGKTMFTAIISLGNISFLNEKLHCDYTT